MKLNTPTTAFLALHLANTAYASSCPLVPALFAKALGQDNCTSVNIICAINRLCGKEGGWMVSENASPVKGEKYRDGRAFISATCPKQEYISQENCYRQMYKTCAARREGIGLLPFGSNGCQIFAVINETEIVPTLVEKDRN